MSAKKVAYTGLLCTLAMIFGYIESLFPLSVAIPGIKLGLSNLVLLVCLYQSIPLAWGVMVIKVIVSSLLFSGMSAFFYSLSGGVFSLLVMSVLVKSKKFSTISVSIAGGVFHNLGQLLAAVFLLNSIHVSYLLPFLLLAGAGAGAVLGSVCQLLFKRLPG